MTPNPDDAARMAAAIHADKTGGSEYSQVWKSAHDSYLAGYAKARERAEEEMRAKLRLQDDNAEIARLRAVVSCLREAVVTAGRATGGGMPRENQDIHDLCREALARAQELEGGG